MHRHHEDRHRHRSNRPHARPEPLDQSVRARDPRSSGDARVFRAWDRELAQRLRDLADSDDMSAHVELDPPPTARTYRPETGLSYDQYRRSGYYDGFVEGQLKAGALPFRYRHGEYAAGGEHAPSQARSFRPPKNYKRSDARIHEEVCERLGSAPELDASDLEVEVHASEVTLRGSVPQRSMRFAAEELAASVFGVEDVHNQLRVAGSARGTDQVTVHTTTLAPADEPLRAACEREAAQVWPGARVFVDMLGQRYRAAVYLPEDGLQPDTSAQQSAPRESARAALDELLRALRSQPSLRS